MTRWFTNMLARVAFVQIIAAMRSISAFKPIHGTASDGQQCQFHQTDLGRAQDRRCEALVMARRGPDRDRARCFGSTPPRQASGQAAVAQAAEEADATALRNGASAGLVLITTSSSRQLSSSAVRFACDSPLEGDGFEPPVPLWRMAPGPASAELREVPARQLRFAPPLEESEPSVPFDRCSVTAGKNPSWEAAVSAGRRAVWLHRAGRGSERWPPVPVDLFYAAMPRRVSLSLKSQPPGTKR